jgi:flagellar protein FliS
MNIYQQRVLEGASGVELTVALYDGIIRFMRQAIAAVEREDAGERRVAVKRAMDILMHLQVTLKMDAGGQVAEILAEFYAAMFALMLQGSTTASKEKFEQVIREVLNVRGAWQQVVSRSAADKADEPYLQSAMRLGGNGPVASAAALESNTRASQTSSWTA